MLLASAGAALLAFCSAARAAEFTNGFDIEQTLLIPAGGGSAGQGDPYPATLNVSGLPGNAVDVRVRLGAMAHTNPSDIDLLLVAPGGQQVMLMSDACGSDLILNEFFEFARSAPSPLPQAACKSGTYRPANYGAFPAFADPMPPPAPPPTGIAYPADLSALNGVNPNGVWRLFANDDSNAVGGTGGIIGWALEIHVPARCGGLPATLVGANGKRDRLIGTKRRDVIVGLSGADVINGKGGRDVICGGKGKDLLIGGGGRDRIFGGKGRDVCRVARNDRVKGCEKRKR